jgi:hypothetical protein
MTHPILKMATAAVLALQAALGLYVGLPGQMSTDSVIQLYEGRTLHFISFNPPLMSLLLGLLDRIGNAPIEFVVISQAMLSASAWLVFAQSSRITAPRLALAGLVLLNPVLLIYAGIVWKDVLLAHSVVLAFLLIAWQRRRRTPVTPLVAAFIVVLLTLIVGARQQGVLFAVPAGLWAVGAVGPRRRARLVAGIVFLVLPFAANRLLDSYASGARANAQVDAVSTGLRLLAQFDLAGVLAHGGALPAATPPALADELRVQSLRYSPYRVDTLTGPRREFWALNGIEAGRLWCAAIAANPGAYARHRVAYFAALVGLDNLRYCAPLYTGVAGPVTHESVDGDLTALLGLSAGPSHASQWVQDFAEKRADTPLFEHVAYAAILAVIGLWLFLRRDRVLATLALCALLYLASYSIVGIACDFRYGYTLTVATTLLAAYACLNLGLSPGAGLGRRPGVPGAGFA